MSDFVEDLLQAADHLCTRRKGQRGPIKTAFVRRSLSTSYYALFHFCLDEAASRLVGSGSALRQRRRLVLRTFSHGGLTTAFDKLKGAHIDRSVADLFQRPSTKPGPIATPDFVRALANTYVDARGKREDADYNLGEPFDKADARQLHNRVASAIRGWQAANTPADRDTKHAVALLLSLKGKLRD